MKLSVLAIFRNEEHILDEWLQHYIHQGVDHFYLINNASTDSSLEVLQKYNNITVKYESYVGPTEILNLGGRQVEAYNEFLPEIDTDWLLVCDLDEFAYARKGTIKDFLLTNANRFDQYLIPLKTFNSNNQKTQPASVINGFTRRWAKEKYTLYKPIVKKTSIYKIWINYCTLKNGLTANGNLSIISSAYISNTPSKVQKETDTLYRCVDGGILDTSFIVANHYNVQSEEWFWKVKATRGTATWHGGAKMPAKDWFTWIWNRVESRPSIDDYELIEITNKYGNV